ncbi:MAG: glycosyltransferase family 2 protein [Vicinamibacterales bacterium]
MTRAPATHSISVVIATRNRQALLSATLAALARQDWPADRVEIIVADNGSVDDTASVVSSAAGAPGAPAVRYLFVTEPGKSAAVNQALAIAGSDIIAFTDDDVRPESGWLRALATAFEETGADFVAGRILPHWESPPPAWLSPAVYGVIAVPANGDRRLAITSDCQEVIPIGANMAVRTSVVHEVGGLRNDLGKIEGSLRTGEDHEFFLRMLRAGCRGVYEPSAIVHHRVGSERLTRAYFREWLHQNGRDVARLEAAYESATTRRLFNTPRYLWRQAAADLGAAMIAAARRDPAARFNAATRLLWFAGYVRERWFGEAFTPSSADRSRSRFAPLAG